MSSSISGNLADLRSRMENVAKRSGRAPNAITLVAVSKGKPVSMICEAFEAGQRIFGENYAQELQEKRKELEDLPIEWHFIGHLQKNKVKLNAPVVRCVESIDSLPLADTLDRKISHPVDCLIEVNLGGEETKSGVPLAEVEGLAAHVVNLSHLNLRGLMTIPPYDPDPEKNRPYFKKLKNTLDTLNETLTLPTPLQDLSMGMSHDFEVAIEEGATIVRIGTAIFGERI